MVEDWDVKQSCVWRSCMWKTVCDKDRWCVWQNCVSQSCVWKMVCQRWWVTKLCVKDGVWQSGVWKMVWRKMVCDKVVCERWCGERRCATKLCVKDGVVKDGVWQSGVWRMVCDKVVWDKSGVWKMVYDKVVWKMVCQGRCVKDGVWQSGVWQSCVWKILKDSVWQSCVWKIEGDKFVCERWCDKDGGWQCGVWKMVCQRWCVTKLGVKEGVWKMLCDEDGVWKSLERGCMKDGVWKMVCDRGVWKIVCDKDGVWRHSQPNAISATPAKQNEGGCVQVARLPRETKVDVTKCHACHAKCPGVTRDQAGPSAPPSAMSATPATQNDRGCEIVPRLPGETKVDATKCHACHAKCRGVTRDQARHPVPWVPRLPRKTTVDVRLCHACHVNPRWMSPSATPAMQSAAASRANKLAQARHPVPWVPRLPGKTKVDVSKCHACQMKPRWMSPSATPATQSAVASRAINWAQARHPVPWVPRLPRKTTVDVRLCHACHVKRTWMSPSATPATQN